MAITNKQRNRWAAERYAKTMATPPPMPPEIIKVVGVRRDAAGNLRRVGVPFIVEVVK